MLEVEEERDTESQRGREKDMYKKSCSELIVLET